MHGGFYKLQQLYTFVSKPRYAIQPLQGSIAKLVASLHVGPLPSTLATAL